MENNGWGLYNMAKGKGKGLSERLCVAGSEALEGLEEFAECAADLALVLSPCVCSLLHDNKALIAGRATLVALFPRWVGQSVGRSSNIAQDQRPKALQNGPSRAACGLDVPGGSGSE